MGYYCTFIHNHKKLNHTGVGTCHALTFMCVSTTDKFNEFPDKPSIIYRYMPLFITKAVTPGAWDTCDLHSLVKFKNKMYYYMAR